MGKNKDQKDDNMQSNKTHKTLREKLRKKREELKKHKKQKSEKKKLYNAQQQKQKYFQKGQQKQQQNSLNFKKIGKCIQKFINIYEDDVQDFYKMFQTLDMGAIVDISEMQAKMQKCLKKLFKNLPLQKTKMQYQKEMDSQICLKTLIKQLVTSAIEKYMEQGTQSQGSQGEEDEEDGEKDRNKKEKKEKKDKKKKDKKEKKEVDPEEEKVVKNQMERQSILLYEDLQLYPNRIQQQTVQEEAIGPSIPAQQREFLAKMFEQQLQKGIPQQQQMQIQQQRQKNENNEFERIFSMSTQKNQKANVKSSIDDLPEDRLAEGSARLGEKQEVNQEEIDEYNRIHRPRKLIEEYQEMKRLGKYAQTDPNGKKKRVPFDRERDIVNGGSRSSMNNGVFFDFKERMTKPQGTNNFL